MGWQLLLLLLLLLVAEPWAGGDEQGGFTRSLYRASIPENSAARRYVQPAEKMGVRVSDGHVQVRYKVVAGDKERQFKAESRLVGDFWLLLIRTRTESAAALNREYEDEYRLRVRGVVHRGEQRLPDVHCEVLVEVTDTNDLSPLFFPTAYNVTVAEDSPVHQVVARLSAYDPDLGVNGEIYYRLQEPSPLFAVHPTMGTVLLTRPLSFHAQPTHHLTVLAEDRGPKPRGGGVLKSSTAQLTVHVEPVNRHRPAIFVRHVHALLQEPEVWAVVVVTDEDVGAPGVVGGLAIVDGDADDHFAVVPGTQPGEFSLRVDPHVAPNPRGYELTLRAWDRGTPPQFADERVSLSPPGGSVVPQWEGGPYEAGVPEEVPPGTPLLQLLAVAGVARLCYEIDSGDEEGRFSLNEATGQLSTARWLDHEAQANYSLVVSATAARSHRAVATVTVRVLDCNDHAPVFDSSPGEIPLEENRPVGSKVFAVRATDKDEAENGYVSYNLVNTNLVPFSVDPFSGEVRTTEVLDYETMRRSYTLRIRATDWGAPFQRQAEMALQVVLKDVNDHRPQFEQVDCVARGGQAGAQLLTLSAVDFDEGASVHYKMEESSDSACFQLNSSTGVLALTCQLERPAQVNVTATDGHHFADVMAVRVLPAAGPSLVECRDAGVIDQLRRQLQLSERNNAPGSTQLDHGEPTAASFLENRHSPELSVPAELLLNESLPVGSVVGRVRASDPDHGYNGRVLYAIAGGDPHSCFRIDMLTGVLSLAAPLDYERAPSHLLNVTAYDQGGPPRMGSQSLLVRVLDVNDNPPQFDKSTYSFVISEDAPNGTSVARLRATDRDEGANAELRFQLDSELFAVDEQTGLLTVRGPLDRERQERHLLAVAVVDGCPEHPLSSTATVSVTLRDVNDHAPQFAPPGPLLVRAREDLPVGAPVACVHAHDADRGHNGRVRYSLLLPGSLLPPPLDVDPDSGLVRLAAPLDFEARRLHNVTVQATDAGQPPRTSVAALLLEVEDVDENWQAPAFAHQVASASVEENQPPGTLVTTVAAADPDGVVYLLTGGTGLGLFAIDEAGGQVRTRVSLDREAGAHYWLEVVARDAAVVPREARLDLHVAVGDRNDGVPLSAQPAYEGAVREDALPGTRVLLLGEPQDLDGGAPVVQQRLRSGPRPCPSEACPFALAEGALVVAGPLDREAQPVHVLQLELSDDGHPAPLSSSSQVRVTLVDVDDHPSRFVQTLFRFRLPDGPPGQGLCQVLARDPDGSAALQYSVVGAEEAFSVEPSTGLLRSRVRLEGGDTHELHVAASGGGQARVQLQVVSRPAQPSQRPLVHGVELSPTLETDPVGHLVAIVHASDPDGDTLWYTITGGNEEGAFMVDCERGFVKVAQPLDRETRASYNLTVQVTDGTASTTTTVRVEVLDANDNWPRFSESLYEVEVSEGTAPGTPILQLTASDADEEPRLSYALHNSAQTGSLALFALEASTGRLRVAQPLDRQACERHLLTVGVRDAGRPEAHWGFARVLVRLADHNDHPPEFPEARYEVRVSEAAAPGTALLALRAHDPDRGRNARLAYAIAHGNGGSAFSLGGTDGVLRVARRLSHQGQPEFFLTVRATDHGEPALDSTATVHVAVTLADDAPPCFEPADQVVEAAENLPPGSFLRALVVRSSSSVTFRLEGGGGGRLFRLDPLAGVLRTGPEPLDFERARAHVLTVRATSLAGAWALGRVEVRVLDRNDHAPRLRQLRLDGSVSEGAPAGSAVLSRGQPLVVAAWDPDAGAHGRLAFAIREPWARRLFRVDPHTGALSVAQPLDREQRAQYQLRVDVSDCGLPRLPAAQPALVTVHVSDVNDSPPRFEHELYNASLLLPTYRGVLLAQVRAHDADLEGPPLRYALLAGDHGGHFQVGAETGEVLVREPGGLEPGALHRLLVGASDGRSETATLVLVSVGRAGAGPLRFARPLWEASVRENDEPGAPLALLAVQGAALGEPLHFSLLTPSAHFAVGARSGLVRCGHPLDREERALHELALEARAASGAVAHARLRVRVLDANDNAPIFVGRPYYALLGVQARPGDLVLRPEAIDLDEGPNGRLAYTLHRGDGRLFTVDERSGELRLRRTPAAPGEHALVLLARDHGTPPLVSYAGVAVKVLDRAAPSFSQPSYVAAVPEDAPPGTAVLTLGARGVHPLLFHLSSGGDQFALDAATGVLSLAEPLDHESRPQHELVARATDSVTGAHSEVPVSVRVQDVNDCAPLFEQVWHNASMSEAASVGSALLEVRVTDRDGPPPGPQLRLLPPGGPFRLEGATVRLGAPLDREACALHQLRLVASDAGGLSATARLWVTVLDMNDNPPSFGQPQHEALLDSRARPGQFVARLRAWDPDASGTLAYALLPGGHPFAIDRAQGVVTLSSVPAAWAPSWDLGVWVTDGAYRAETRLRVSLVASNEHAPRFSQPLYDAVVAENLPAGTPVAHVSAHDPDPLGGPLTYALGPSPAAGRLFALDPATGALVTREPLDRERQQTHEIPVWAEDGGGRRAWALVRVAVADANDNEPVFGAPEYEASVWANTSVGSTLVQVRAFDEDQEGQLLYSLHDAPSNVSALFNITHDSGELYLKAPLKGPGVFQFFVRASDGGPWVGALAAVTVAAVSAGGPLPPRLPAVRDLFVREGAPLGSPVLALGPGVSLGGPPTAPFGLDAAGRLVVAAPLDRERQALHRLTLRAGAAGGLAAAHDVTVHVMDDNDCEPQFEAPAYEAAVAENEPAGCLVVRLAAHDPDSAGRRLTYEFFEEADPAADIFDIDPLSGAVTTRVALDREAVPLYNFSVRVHDEGLRSSTAWVHVRVLDVNDNPPALEAAAAEVAEDAVAGTVVARLGLADADQEPAPVRYYLLAGDPGQQFAVGPAGDLFVQRALDREARPSYALTVAASDGLHVASARLDVRLLDANDSPPVCLKPQYTELVSEGIAVGTPVLTVEAADADEGPNAQLDFYLSGVGSEDFALDANSGVLRTVRPLDREQRDRYLLVATVRDVSRWEWQCNVSLELLVSDVNDNAPTFDRDAYRVALPENASVGRLVAQPHATDRDLGPNRRLRYSLLGEAGRGWLSVDGPSGLVRLERTLERGQRLELALEARDAGSPPLSARVPLTVLVQGDGGAPEFTQQAYSVVVSEAAPLGSPVDAGLRALSRNASARITYALVAGNERAHFSIEPTTGVLRVSGPLDFEQVRGYQLAVEARDGGLSARAWLNLTLLDANDNAPVFGGGPYSAAVREDAPPGHPLLQVQASDADSGGELRYRLLPPGGPFALHPASGQLSVAGALDHETVSRYVLEVECWDGGSPPLSARTQVRLEVVDVNEHPPQFDRANYTAAVPEGRPAGWPVLRWSLSDADGATGGGPFHVELLGDPGAFFQLDGAELLRLARPLPPHSQHQLRLRALDGGRPPLAAEAPLTVLAVDPSRFQPQLQPLSVGVRSFLDDFPGAPLGRVRATDEDPHDRVRLSLSGPHAPLFVLDAESGALRALPGLDAGHYELNVSAWDGVTPPAHGPVSVHVVAISEEALAGATALRLGPTSPARFLGSHRRALLRALRSALGVRLRDLLLVSVQPAEEEQGALEALVSVAGVPPATVSQRLEAQPEALREAGVRLLPEACSSRRCVHGQCRHRLALDPSDPVLLEAEGLAFVSPRHSRPAACLCAPGFGGEACEGAVEERRPIWLGGHGYAHYVLARAPDRHLRFSARLRTQHPDGLLLHTAGPREYALLEVSGGQVQFRLDCGGGEGVVRVEGRRVDDGVWHSVRVERRGRQAHLWVDGGSEASGGAPGAHDSLDLATADLHLGGSPATAGGPGGGLVGCLDDVRLDGRPLPLRPEGGRQAGPAQLRHLAGVHFGCRLPPEGDPCHSQPCLRGATCRALAGGGYACACPPHSQGPRCELVEPCAAECAAGASCPLQCGGGGGSSSASGWWWWPSVGGGLLLLLLLLLLLVALLLAGAARRRRRKNPAIVPPAKNCVLVTANIRRKMSNLEPRPASYTAVGARGGGAEAPLNNWDTVRSYGSAADDLECRYQPNNLRCCRDKVPNDLKAALSPVLPPSSAASIASDLPGYCWDYSDLAAHVEEASSADEGQGQDEEEEEGCPSDAPPQADGDDRRYACLHPDQYLPRHCEPAVCAIEDSEEEAVP